MPEWLAEAFDWLVESLKKDNQQLALADLAIRIGSAFILGCLVAAVYAFTQPRRSERLALISTLVLLSTLIAMITLVIGSNQARAFSLVGALAIIRFRTVVEDTRDTAFVIFAVAVGMAAGAGALIVCAVGVPLVALGAFLFRPRINLPRPDILSATLTIRLGAGHDPEALLAATLDRHLSRHVLRNAASARQGSALDLTYVVLLRTPESGVALVNALNRVDGVQSVELRVD